MIIDLGIGRIPLNTLKELLHAEGDAVLKTPLRLVTNSKEIRENDLFCALRGNIDGHTFAKEAEENGALAILAEERTDASLPHIIVGNTAESLAIWAHAALKDHPCRRIAVTGSVGKTTTKNAIAAMLGTRFRVHASQENYNNLLGVAFTVLSMPRDSEILIAELGTNHPGEIAALAKIIEPNDAVITRIGHAHIGAFGTLDAIAREKLSVRAGMKRGGRLYVPKNEPLLSLHPIGISTKKINTLPTKDTDIATHASLSFAKAIAKTYFLSKEEIAHGEIIIKSRDARRKTKWAYDICLIDDAYNASPEAMTAAFAYLAAQSRSRKILVLGDMLELGEHTAAAHRRTGKEASATADLVFFFGEYQNFYLEGARGQKAKAVGLLSTDAMALAKEILPFLRKGDTLLFKASHSLRADLICDALFSLLSNAT